ncbi:MAG TPA: CPBP family intramembrane glutamic endopeptidase [Gaiellales bacterium]|jgi:membrane protease YdiL (CAAX protease family)
MDEMPVADTPDMPSGRWWLLVLAAAACTALYLASTISAYLLSELGGRTIAGAVIGMAAVAVLCIVAVRLAATLAFPGGGAPGDIIGRARSHSVGSAVTVQVVFLLLISPLLTVLGRTVGFRGTTNIALHHRSAAVVLLLTWIAVVIAPWMEEVSMRGFLFSGLDARLGFWPAAIASSLVWAGLHGVSGVLVPFTVEGIVLCWIRRRTGSVRTGIALHASQNVLASLVSGAGLLVVPAVAAVVVSLIATRADAPNTVGPSVSRLLARAGRTAERVAARIPTGGERPLVWILAGAALCAGIVLEAASLELAVGTGAVLTAGRIVIVALSLPPLAWLLLSARRTWDAPAAGCLAGAAGCAIIIASRVGILLGSATLVPLVGLGYTLAGFGFLALATTAIDVRARAGAVVAGLLLLATLTPIPYLITTAQAMVDQTLITSLGAALAIVSIGLTLRRPDRSRTDYAWGPQTPAPMPPL